ncbi:MAG TPA: ABC transporter permease [Clostridia bacterium]|nr:ABC transporter permease [Clostridia bacterium]
MTNLKYALRLLVKNPGFTLTAIITLALGIGTTSAVYTVVNAVLLRPLPYPVPEQLVQVVKWSQTSASVKPSVNSYMAVSEFLSWREENQVLSCIAAHQWQGANLSGGDEPERVDCGKVTATYFPLLGATFCLGRGFLQEEDAPGGATVVVLSHQIWMWKFGGDTNIVGRSITLDKKAHIVVGVLSPNFQPLHSYVVYTPFALDRQRFAMPQVIGRLKPGITREQAQVALDAIYQHTRNPKENGRIILNGLQAHLTSKAKPSLMVYLGAVVLVLVIACVNLANMLLARSIERRREIAIRISLGACRVDIVRQLLTETLMLASIGTLLGLCFAFVTKDVLAHLIADAHTRFGIPFDFRVLACTSAIGVFTVLCFGLSPALLLSRISTHDLLKEGGRSGKGRNQQRLTGILVILETALALVLVFGAGLLVKSFLELRSVDPGFRPDHILSLSIRPSKVSYPTVSSQADFFKEVIERLRQLPGVAAVGANMSLPLTSLEVNVSGLQIEGRPPDAVENQVTRLGVVNDDYFQAMGIPLKKGRTFSEHDRSGSPPVVLINEKFAQRYFGGEDPIGKHVGWMNSGKTDWCAIVGVVGDERNDMMHPAEPRVYRCYLQAAQAGMGLDFMSLAIRTLGEPTKLARAVRSQIWTVDKDQPVFGLMPLDQRLAESLTPQRTNALLASALAILALGLAGIGVYGILSFSVAQRTYEIGVRMALGGQTSDILKLVMAQGMKLALAGIGIGVIGSLALTKYLASLLYEVSVLDFPTFIGAVSFLAGTALIACYIPARRAASVQPMIALRDE